MNQDNIFGLDIPMQDLMVMHEADRIQKISNDKRCTFLSEGSPAWDRVIELTVGAEFHDRIEVFLIMKESIVLNNVGMFQKCLYF